MAAAFLLGVYFFVWVYMRPSHFELTPVSVDVVWPIRRFSTPIAAIESVELLSTADFRARYGYGLRIGAGGLGLIFARAIIDEAADVTVILTGRSALSAGKQQAIEALAAANARVIYQQADITAPVLGRC